MLSLLSLMASVCLAFASGEMPFPLKGDGFIVVGPRGELEWVLPEDRTIVQMVVEHGELRGLAWQGEEVMRDIRAPIAENRASLQIKIESDQTRWIDIDLSDYLRQFQQP